MRKRSITILIQTANGQKKSFTYENKAELRRHITYSFGQTYLSDPDWDIIKLIGEKMPKTEAVKRILSVKEVV